MTIRLIAKDLYRLKQEVERLEREMEKAGREQKPAIEDRLRKARAEMLRMQRVLEGAKEPSPYRKPR